MRPPAAWRPPERPGEDAAAAAVLSALSVVAVLTLGRVFTDRGWVLPLVVASLVPHGVGFLMRRGGRSSPAVTAASLAGLLVLVVWVVAPETTRMGVPSGRSLHRLVDLLGEGGQVLRDETAPVRPAAGVLLLCMAVAGLAAATADALAFSMRAVLGAVTPSLAVFVVASSLGPGGGRTLHVVAFLALTGTFALLQGRSGPGTAGGRPTGPETTRRPRRLGVLAAGAPLLAVAIAAGLLLGPLVPGARAQPWLDYRSGGGGRGAGYATVSPLVDIKSRLLGRTDREVMTVRAERPAYWRMVSLDDFDGDTWTLDSGTRPGPDDAGGPPGVPLLRQEYSVDGLGGRWVPAAAEPVAVKGLRVRAVPESRTLVSSTPITGRRFVVWSQPPVTDPTPAQQAATAATVSPGPHPSLLSLPPSFPSEVRRLARSLVSGAANPWEAARRLEAFFLDGSFTYDLTVPTGHGDDAIRTFLRERRGFCEQFAGTYAALARAAGLPSRVAVGFTPGRRSGGVFHVTDADAHAWPEVWFPGLGWVPFEPTPAGDQPGQPGSPRDPATTGTEPDDPADPSTGSTTTTTTAPAAAPPTSAPGGPGTDPAGPTGPAGTARRVWPGLLAVGLVVAAIAVRRPVRARRLRRRRRRAATATAAVLGAWLDTLDRLSETGLGTGAWLTPTEVAAGGRSGLTPAVSGEVARLAGLVSEAAFSPRTPDPDIAAQAWSTADRIRGMLHRDRRARRRRTPRRPR